MKTQNKYRFCHRHYPVQFTMHRLMMSVLLVVIPWIIVVVGCALVGSVVVELVTKH